MIAKRIIVIPFLICLTLMSLSTFFGYMKIVREKDSIAFIPYSYGMPDVRRIKRCPLECVNTIRMCAMPGPLFFCLTYTLNGKNYLLLDCNPVHDAVGKRSIRDYDWLIPKIKELAQKEKGEGFYCSSLFTLRGFAGSAFICLFMAGISAIVVSRA